MVDKELSVNNDLLYALENEISFMAGEIFPNGFGSVPRSEMNTDQKLFSAIYQSCEIIESQSFTLNDFFDPEISLGMEIVLSKVLRDSIFSLPIGSRVTHTNRPEPMPMDHIEFAVVSNWHEEYPEMVRLLKIRLVNAEKIKDAEAVGLLLRSLVETITNNYKLRAEYRHTLSNDRLRELFFTADYPEFDGRNSVAEVQLEYSNHPFQLQIHKDALTIDQFSQQNCDSLASWLEWMKEMKMESDARKVSVASIRNCPQNIHPSFALVEEIDVHMVENNPFYEFVWHVDKYEYNITHYQDKNRYSLPRFVIPEMATMSNEMIQVIDKNIENIRLFASDENSFSKTSVATRTPHFFDEQINELAHFNLYDEIFEFEYSKMTKNGDGEGFIIHKKFKGFTFSDLVAVIREQIKFIRQ